MDVYFIEPLKATTSLVLSNQSNLGLYIYIAKELTKTNKHMRRNTRDFKLCQNENSQNSDVYRQSV